LAFIARWLAGWEKYAEDTVEGDWKKTKRQTWKAKKLRLPIRTSFASLVIVGVAASCAVGFEQASTRANDQIKDAGANSMETCRALEGIYQFHSLTDSQQRRSTTFLRAISRPSKAGAAYFQLLVDVRENKLRVLVFGSEGKKIDETPIRGACDDGVLRERSKYSGGGDGGRIVSDSTWTYRRDEERTLIVETNTQAVAYPLPGIGSQISGKGIFRFALRKE